jgi:hypothetical protein
MNVQEVARMPVPKMVKNGHNSVLPFLPGLKKTITQRNQEQIQNPKPPVDHGRRIKTILGQFRNKHARYQPIVAVLAFLWVLRHSIPLANSLKQGKVHPDWSQA